jgi:fluoroacetyl-CoA thioesterase
MAAGTTLTPGMTHVREYVVTDAMTAHAGGNRGFHVLSGPALIQEFELGCIELIQPLLDSGKATVAISFDLRHLAASPVGIRVSTTPSYTTWTAVGSHSPLRRMTSGARSAPTRGRGRR